MKKNFKNLQNWIKENKKEFIILLGILLVGSFLRFYRISEYMTFLGDEGRDAIIVRRLLLYADPILVGPGTSIGNMYLGPLYYYFMAPWLWLFNFSPVGPAVGVALLGVATVFLIWLVAREWFGKVAAVVTSLLFAIAPVVIIYSRSSWNPNIMPFFALLCIYSIWRVWEKLEYKWLIVASISFAWILQSHYLGGLLGPVVGLFAVLSLVKAYKNGQTKQFIMHSLGAGVVFALLMSPLLIFDARHGWRNLDSIKKFFFERQTTVSARPWNAFPKMIPQLDKINGRLVTAMDTTYGPLVTILLFVPLAFITVLNKKIKVSSTSKRAYLILFTWLFVALIGFGLYKQEIYDHYFGFIFAVPFLLIGGLCQNLIDSSYKRGVSLVIPLVGILVIINLVNNPIKYSPNRQLQRTEEVADEIVKLSNNEKFNLAVIAERNYDDAYQYFLENKNAKMVDIDPQRADETIADQLFVICEMEEIKCDPTHSPKAEVAGFGWSKIEEQWKVSGTTVYKLVHSQ